MNTFAQDEEASKQLQNKQNLSLQTPSPESSPISHAVFPNDNISWNHRLSEKERTLETILANIPLPQMRKQELREVPLLGLNHTAGRWAD